MRVVVTSEFHYRATARGAMVDGKCDYAYWAQLLAVFDEVQVFARLAPGDQTPTMQPVEGPGVSVIAAPDFVGTRGLVPALPGLAVAARRAVARGDAFLLHAPGVMASVLRPALVARGRRYGVEVVGDPQEALVGAGRVLSALRGVAARDLRSIVAGACATRYVTRTQLQRLYPPRAGTPSFAISDAYIPDAVVAGPGAVITDESVLALGFVGALFRPYKGLDVLLEAMAVGLPALATAVGGVPELLDAEELVPVEDAAALAQAIDRLAADPARRRRLAAANRAKVACYAATPAQAEMRRFFRAIRDAG